ncbi:MAG: FtsX-like permease family protein [Bacteroidales bacterium]|nr:FtsX-like permease family protein [Bacteroidales bacterium]
MLIKLIYKEIIHRKLNFVLALLAVTFAVAFFVSFFTANEASNRETIRLTRDMGFNLRIIPKETDMNKFWTEGYSEFFMPEEYVNQFWGFKDFSFAHLTATLHKKIIWHNKEVVLTGIAPEIEPSGKKKTAMIFSIEPGTVYVGYELAKDLQICQEDSIEIYERSFTVEKTLSETGSIDDIRIYGALSEFQDLIGLNGKINEIMALNCLCVSPGEKEPLEILREQLDQVLPEAKVIMNTTIANAREKQRHMLEKYFALVTTFVIFVIAVWIGALAMMNVRERQKEIGILRAIGHNGRKIAGLFIGKAMIIGIVSAVLGYAIGTILALKFGHGIFKITAGSIKPIYSILIWSIIAAPVFSAIAAFLPTMVAILKDPAITLRKE